MLTRIQYKFCSSINAAKKSFNHVGVLVLTNDLSSNEVSQLVVSRNLARYANYDDRWLFKFKLYFEKLLLSQRMKNMEKAIEGIPSIYESQNKLIDEVTNKLNIKYPESKFSFYKKTISDAQDVKNTMDSIVSDEVDHLVLFPLRPAYTCSEWSREIFDISTYLKLNKKKINFGMSCIQPYRLRKDFTQLMANSIEKALKSLKQIKKLDYVVLFLAPHIRLQEINHGDLCYASYLSMANTIMSKVNLPNHHVVTWHLNENNEDNFLMPNTFCALRYLARNHKKNAFLLVPLSNIFDGRLKRYEYDLDLTSSLKKIEPHANLSKLVPLDRNPEMINVFYKIICDHMDNHTQNYPWYLLEKDPDCVHKNCRETRAVLSQFFPKPN